MMDKYLDNEHRFMLTELKSVILLILTIIDLIFIFLSTIYSFNFKVENLFADYDFLVCLLLFVDLAYEFYTSNKSFKEFLIDDKNIISLISLFPFDLLFRYFSIFRLFRFIKLIKIVRIWNVKKDMDSLFYFIQHHLFKLLFIVLMVYVAISSVLLIILDNSITNLADAFWFIVVTTTTVGYGDIVPVTHTGRALTILTIIIGTIFVAIFTAYLSAIYNEEPEMETRTKIIHEIEKNNEVLTSELKYLNEKIESIEKENKQLKDTLEKVNENIESLKKESNE